MQGKERIQYVTRHFSELQGLRILPFAAYLAAGAVYDATWGYPHHRTWGMIILWLIGLGSLVAYWRLGHYYRREFGWVQPQTDARRQRVTAGLFVFFLIFSLVLAGIEQGMSATAQTWVLIIWWGVLALTLAAIWAVNGFSLGWPRRFSLWPVLLLLVTGLWNLPGAPSQTACYPNGYNQCVAFDLAVAAAVVVGGYYNHRLLVETLNPLPEESHG